MFRLISFCFIFTATIVCAGFHVEAQTSAGRAPAVDTSGESYATSFSPLPDGGSITSTAFEGNQGFSNPPVNFYVAQAQQMPGYQQQSYGYQQQPYGNQQALVPQQNYQPQMNAQYVNPYQTMPYQNSQLRYAMAPMNYNQPMQYPAQPQQYTQPQQTTPQQNTQPQQNAPQQNTQPLNRQTSQVTIAPFETTAASKQSNRNTNTNFEQVGYRQPTYQPIGPQQAQWQTPIQTQIAANTNNQTWRTANYQAPGCCGQQQPSPFKWAPPAQYTPQQQNFQPPAPQFAPVSQPVQQPIQPQYSLGQPPVPAPPTGYNPYLPTPSTQTRTQWKPLVPLRALPPGLYVAQGLVGQPVAYVDGEPVRNFFRYISP